VCFVNVYVCQSNLMKLPKPCVHVLVVVCMWVGVHEGVCVCVCVSVSVYVCVCVCPCMLITSMLILYIVY